MSNTRKPNILVLNLGSTSTKVALFAGEENVLQKIIRHTPGELSGYASINDQYDFPKEVILSFLREAGVELGDLQAIVSRGGTIKPVPGGVYEISEVMLNDLLSDERGVHPCNLGCRIAYEIAQKWDLLALTVDPPATDELCDYARLSGIRQISRRSSFHALNQKATARRLARQPG